LFAYALLGVLAGCRDGVRSRFASPCVRAAPDDVPLWARPASRRDDGRHRTVTAADVRHRLPTPLAGPEAIGVDGTLASEKLPRPSHVQLGLSGGIFSRAVHGAMLRIGRAFCPPILRADIRDGRVICAGGHGRVLRRRDSAPITSILIIFDDGRLRIILPLTSATPSATRPRGCIPCRSTKRSFSRTAPMPEHQVFAR
jgi:hypothetical protein